MPARTVCAFFALMLLAVPGHAFPVPSRPGTLQALMDCGDGADDRFHNAQSRDAPAPIAASFAGDGAKLAFRTCRDADRNTHYFIREHRPNRNGVCRSFEREVFPARSEFDRVSVTRLYDGNAPDHAFPLRGWTASPPPRWDALGYRGGTRELGFTAAGECPPGDDPRYMALTNVTDGALKSFEQTWRRIAASPESLAAAIAKLPVQANPLPQFNTPARQEQLRARIVPAIFRQGARPTYYDCGGTRCSATFGDHFRAHFAAGPEGVILTGFSAVFRG